MNMRICWVEDGEGNDCPPQPTGVSTSIEDHYFVRRRARTAPPDPAVLHQRRPVRRTERLGPPEHHDREQLHRLADLAPRRGQRRVGLHGVGAQHGVGRVGRPRVGLGRVGRRAARRQRQRDRGAHERDRALGRPPHRRRVVVRRRLVDRAPRRRSRRRPRLLIRPILPARLRLVPPLVARCSRAACASFFAVLNTWPRFMPLDALHTRVPPATRRSRRGRRHSHAWRCGRAGRRRWPRRTRRLASPS